MDGLISDLIKFRSYVSPFLSLSLSLAGKYAPAGATEPPIVVDKTLKLARLFRHDSSAEERER